MKSLIKILSTISNVAISYASYPGRDAGSLYKAIRKFKELQKISDSKLRSSLRYSINKEYISIKMRKEKTYFELTHSGKHRLNREKINSSPPKQKLWDKKWRIVIFDVPESHKKSRDGFAKSLKIVGFTQIQKSVFAFPYPCTKELETLIGFHGVDSFCTIIIAESLGNSRRLEKIYSLHT